MITELGIPDNYRQWNDEQKLMFQFHFLIKVG